MMSTPAPLAPPRRRVPWSKIAWRVTLSFLYLFLLAPLLVVIVLSFNSGSGMVFPLQGFSFRWYTELLQNTTFMTSLRVSFFSAIIVAVLVLCLGVPVAYAINRYRFRGRGVIESLFLAPLLVPTVVLGLSLLLVFSPLRITGTYLAIVIAHIGITIPYVIRTTLMSLSTADTASEEAARVLGASGITVFRRVTLPLILPGVVSGGVIAFIISFDEAVISLFVAGFGRITLPVEMFRYVETRADPQIAALSVVLILISVVVIVLVERLAGLGKVLRG